MLTVKPKASHDDNKNISHMIITKQFHEKLQLNCDMRAEFQKMEF